MQGLTNAQEYRRMNINGVNLDSQSISPTNDMPVTVFAFMFTVTFIMHVMVRGKLSGNIKIV